MYPNIWIDKLENYNWDKLFNKVDSKTFERKINQKYYPLFESYFFSNQSGKIKSKYFNILSRQLSINPDWDEDVILNLFKINKKINQMVVEILLTP